MHNRAVVDNLRVRQRATIGICHVPCGSHPKNLKFARQTSADAILDGVVGPCPKLKVPERRVVESDCGDGAENVKRIACADVSVAILSALYTLELTLAENRRVQTLPPWMVRLIVRCTGRKITVSIPVRVDEKALNS